MTKRSIQNQVCSDVVTPLVDSISAPGTTVHIFYAVKMGPQYQERYERYLTAPDIRRREIQHEELLACYPETWVQEIMKYCGVMKGQIL